jgi:hypothetical protein
MEWLTIEPDNKRRCEMEREIRETGPLGILLCPVIAIGTIGTALLRLVLGPCDEGNEYEYQF